MILAEFQEIIPFIDKYTYHQVYEMIESLGLSNLPVLKMPANSSNGRKRKIYRGRKSEEIPFCNARELSYNPNPKGFDRASTPCSPMFYGAISMNESDIPMITNTAETSEVIRNDINEYSELCLTFGEYIVKRDFFVALIIFHKEFLNVNPQYKDYVYHFKDKVPHDYEIIRFFSYLFSLKLGRYYNNKVTSIFTAYLFAQENEVTLDAIIYPSVRLDGAGTNIAFHPEAADEILELKRVREYKVFMKDKNVTYDLIKEATIIQPDGSFIMLDNPSKKGDDLCKRELIQQINITKHEP